MSDEVPHNGQANRRDKLSVEQRSFAMSRVKSRDTKPEIMLRRALHARGLRYRLHGARMVGRPDIVLPRWRAVVFVHGCFWHGHECARAAPPQSNVDFWAEKIGKNADRDAAQVARLRAEGWRVATVWQCALLGKNRLGAEFAAEHIHNWLRCGGDQLVLAEGAADTSSSAAVPDP
ncbi:very short patch repair endonuclease [Labrys okinawensis]|uniref:Very short patch repair endonuclease n=1 Tax=Labrys okinawensis TaxID=346911 RepID=A0A2S9Q7X6_9HYPH|nr:very short patch repair endonuclease [Labrys okinawensis]PRH85457.1 very short patch repair endonuclease [Labrys okinawensis]